MARAYRRVKSGSPVPYPDGSGRMLMDEIVIGEEWEQFVPLGYIEPLEGDVDPGMFTDQAYSGAFSPILREVPVVSPTVMERSQEPPKESDPFAGMSIMEKASLAGDKS